MIAEVEFAFSAESIVGILFGGCSLAAAFWNGIKARRESKRAHAAEYEAAESRGAIALKDSHVKRIDELEAQLQRESDRASKVDADWAARYQKNQDFHHEQAARAQVLLLQCNEKCSELQATRDFSPILAYMKKQDEVIARQTEDRQKQTEVNREIFEALRKINNELGKLAQK